MRLTRRTVLFSSLLLSLSILAAGDQQAPRGEYKVSRFREMVYSKPRSFSRRVASVKRGTVLDVMEEKKVGRRQWMLVTIPGQGKQGGAKQGWALRLGDKTRAGEKAAPLAVAAMSSEALTIKGLLEELDRHVEGFPKHFPQAEENVVAAEAAYLDADEVDAFIRAGNLNGFSEE